MGVRSTFSSDLCFLMAFSGEVEVENERMAKELFFIPALLLLLVIVLIQRRRATQPAF